jgi:hypothetical protein
VSASSLLVLGLGCLVFGALTLFAVAVARLFPVGRYEAGRLDERGIPLSGGSAREDGRPNTSFQASTLRSSSLYDWAADWEWENEGAA